jgi:hypothetical protein
MLFFLNNFSYSPQFTLLSQSHTLSSSQFFADSSPSTSENSDSVGLVKDGFAVMIAGALRLDWMVAVCADDEERFEEVDTSGAGKGVFEANIAIARNVSYA